ncbi:GTPase ObgE, partial [Staphylococcus hominis]
VERTKVIVHMIDMSGSEARDPYEDYQIINKELKAYEQRLEDRPQIVVANKMDLPEAEDQLELFKEQLKEDGHEDVQIIPLSTVTHYNVEQLLFAIADKLEEVKDID